MTSISKKQCIAFHLDSEKGKFYEKRPAKDKKERELNDSTIFETRDCCGGMRACVCVCRGVLICFANNQQKRASTSELIVFVQFSLDELYCVQLIVIVFSLQLRWS